MDDKKVCPCECEIICDVCKLRVCEITKNGDCLAVPYDTTDDIVIVCGECMAIITYNGEGHA